MRISAGLLGSLFLVACSSGGPSTSGVPDDGRQPGVGVGDGEEPGAGARGGASPSAPEASAGAGPTSGASGDSTGGGGAGAPVASGGGNGTIAAGTLTAGAWDDNRNLQRFLDFRAGVVQSRVGGNGILPFTDADHRAAQSAFAPPPGARAKLDISLVIDTTGSMGDELRYLQRELDALATSIQAKYPNADQRWSLVVYKDTTDAYVTRWFDFRSDLTEFRTHLAAQSAGGGGDFPEAPDRALSRAATLAWRGSDTAKLMFWVADAPHHDANAAAMAQAIRDAKARGVHIYPVASSGIDDFTELAMRSAAQLTGGRYLFLTDDSGVGGAHKEPSIPCYFVTKLDRAILRMVDVEVTGTYREPDAADVVRTGGNPENGACQLPSSGPAIAF